jgi:hypothetical protein
MFVGEYYLRLEDHRLAITKLPAAATAFGLIPFVTSDSRYHFARDHFARETPRETIPSPALLQDPQ